MSAPDFSPKTTDLIAYRAAYICANPECNRLTIAPSLSDVESKIKIGEAAHIHDARKKTIRHDPNLADADRAKPENGIWLCASCHTDIDKNKGKDYPATLLKSWKSNHEALIAGLLKRHESPLPLIRRFTNDQRLAQEIVDLISSKGAFFMGHQSENIGHVVLSIKDVRKELLRIGKEIDFERRLKEINEDLKRALREYMNETSKYPGYSSTLMDTMRMRVGVALGVLRDEFGCRVQGAITSIIPN